MILLRSGKTQVFKPGMKANLDEGDLRKTKIFVSGDLDEYKIAEFESKNLPIDGYSVGTRMDVSLDSPFLDIVYKRSFQTCL